MCTSSMPSSGPLHATNISMLRHCRCSRYLTPADVTALLSVRIAAPHYAKLAPCQPAGGLHYIPSCVSQVRTPSMIGARVYSTILKPLSSMYPTRIVRRRNPIKCGSSEACTPEVCSKTSRTRRSSAAQERRSSTNYEWLCTCKHAQHVAEPSPLHVLDKTKTIQSND